MLVACSSGVSARRPMMVIFANEERGAAVENARAALRGRARGARRRRDDILVFSDGELCGWWIGRC